MQHFLSTRNSIKNSSSYSCFKSEIDKKIAEFHVNEFNKIGSLYYSEESFDDFYYGKGSTFPDINGGVGILFEQASSRGHVQETANGILTFPFTIKNQLTAAISTLKAGFNLKEGSS